MTQTTQIDDARCCYSDVLFISIFQLIIILRTHARARSTSSVCDFFFESAGKEEAAGEKINRARTTAPDRRRIYAAPLAAAAASRMIRTRNAFARNTRASHTENQRLSAMDSCRPRHACTHIHPHTHTHQHTETGGIFRARY